MMIPLTRDKLAIVDSDQTWLLAFNWFAVSDNRGHWSARRKVRLAKGSYVTRFMHRELMRAEVGDIVDHLNGNPLDNRICNLRICTVAQNNRNIDTPNVQLIINGVSWCAQVDRDYIGSFPTKDQAIAAWLKERIRRYGKADSHRALVKYGHLL